MQASGETAGPDAYPVSFDVDYPDRALNRVATAFRLFLAIPILVVAAAIGGHEPVYSAGGHARTLAIDGGGLLFLPVCLMLVFRQRYPRWWFDWNLELMRFTSRIAAYLALMDDRYPSTEERQAVALDLPYPDARSDLNRWLPLVKWLLAIPHFIVLFFLWIAAVVAVILAWFAILITGRYPRGLFDFVLGVLRWGTRVIGYAVVLVTDEYPPFRLGP
jgi:hypothetical protein